MRKLLFSIFMLFSIISLGQTNKKFNSLTIYAGLPNGVGAEIGHAKNLKFKDNKLNYFLGFSADFGEKTSNGSNLMFYARGIYALDKHFGITGLGGIEDLNRLVLGAGLRATIPADGFKIIVEPMWRTNGSRVNVGFSLPL